MRKSLRFQTCPQKLLNYNCVEPGRKPVFDQVADETRHLAFLYFRKSSRENNAIGMRFLWSLCDDYYKSCYSFRNMSWRGLKTKYIDILNIPSYDRWNIKPINQNQGLSVPLEYIYFRIYVLARFDKKKICIGCVIINSPWPREQRLLLKTQIVYKSSTF